MAYSRISARRGSVVDLDMTFYRGGVAADPVLYRVEIFRGSVEAANIVAAFPIAEYGTSSYPAPVTQLHSGSGHWTGHYRLSWTVPDTIVVPDIYFDVWYFFSTDPRVGTEGFEPYLSQLLESIQRFWIYPDQWYADGGLDTIKFGFEPMDVKFRKPEVRPLEVGLMPLPLYDYNYNLVAPIIPYLTATITITTEAKETIVDAAACTIKLRQGAYRANPYVISYNLTTSNFYIGTYEYRITMNMPDGTTRVSPTYYLTIS